MSEKFTGEFSPEQQERKEIIELKNLAERYKSERFIIDGIDPEARENNRLVVEAIEAAGKKLAPRFNEVFGINMGGSRIKGYNTKESDIDLVVVTPDTTADSGFVYDAIREELASRGVTNNIDTMMGMWSQYDIETDPEQFVYRVDHHGNELITLFGHTPYRNPNMDLTRLATLEIIQQYTLADYDWEGVADNFAETYLGEHEHLVEKFSERYGVPVAEVAKIFTRALFQQSHKKFGLEAPKPMYAELKRWYSDNKKDLRKHKMNDVYNGVLKHLKEGL
jgi:predicted nucleotidyltransferase